MTKKSKSGSFGDLLKNSGVLSKLASVPASAPCENGAAGNLGAQAAKPKLSAAGQKRSEEKYEAWLEEDRINQARIAEEQRVKEQKIADKRAIIAALEPAPEPKSPPAKAYWQERAEIAARVRNLISTANLTVKEKRPKELDSRSARKVDACIKRGAAMLSSAGRFNDDGPIMGVDFGTSSIKIVVRWPFVTGKPAFATSVPVEMRSGSLPHLWQTVVWLDADDRLTIYPKPKAKPLDGFKANLIKGDGNGRYPSGVTFEEAAIACLALHIAHAAGEASAPGAEHKLDGFSGIHLAVPVATADDAKLMEQFEAIACRAVMLAGSANKLSLAMIRKVLATEIPADVIDNVRVYPELAAVVAGYSGTKERHMGPNVVIDCGAATLDIATFILRPGTGQAAFSIFEAEVAILGAEAWRWAKAQRVTQDDFLVACHDLQRTVFLPTQHHRAPREFGTNPATNTKDVQLIAVGGGMNAKLYRTFTNPLATHYGRQELRLSAPEKLKCIEGTDYSRLLLADGLARQPFDIPEFRKPSEIDDVHKKQIDYSGNYIEN